MCYSGVPQELGININPALVNIILSEHCFWLSVLSICATISGITQQTLLSLYCQSYDFTEITDKN